MIRVTPDFYSDFHCTASACRHSCCIGWEIDLDEETEREYQALPGVLGDRMRRSVHWGEAPHFILDEQERCPFLNERNLCELILKLGEGALCQICADHPRFRNWYPDRVEEGLGLCCEEAARLLLTHEAPIAFLTRQIPGEELEPAPEYARLLKRRDGCIALLQDRSKALEQRICEAFSLYGISPLQTTFPRDLACLRTLECMEEAWQTDLAELKDVPGTGAAFSSVERENLLVYLVYRYDLPYALEGDAGFALYFGRLSLGLLDALGEQHRRRTGQLTRADRVELVRRWSAELEYSEDNLAGLADYFYK